MDIFGFFPVFSHGPWPTAILTVLTAAVLLWSFTSNKPAKCKTIGTRESQLAMWQATKVHSLLSAAHADQPFQVLGMTTLGDQDQMKPLSAFANKGVFTKELDVALLDGRIDIAVHCMKDLPTILPEGIQMAAVMERGDTADAVVLHAKHKGLTLEDLPMGSVIGTSALRRQATLAWKFPHLTTKDIRGNVNTRLAKLDRGEYDAIILAKIGLVRLDMSDRISQVLDQDEYGCAVGQGALAVVCRQGDVACASLLKVLEHDPTRLACTAERGLLRTLEGGCKVPIAVTTSISRMGAEVELRLQARVLSVDGQQVVQGEVTTMLKPGAAQHAKQAGNLLGEDLLSKGAGPILDKIRASS